MKIRPHEYLLSAVVLALCWSARGGVATPATVRAAPIEPSTGSGRVPDQEHPALTRPEPDRAAAKLELEIEPRAGATGTGSGALANLSGRQ